MAHQLWLMKGIREEEEVTAGEVLFYSLIIGSVMYSSEDHCRLVPLTAGEVFISNIPQTLSS